jgi:hypothetical protein
LNSKPVPFPLIRRGPSSEAAPYPTDEQPGPAEGKFRGCTEILITQMKNETNNVKSKLTHDIETSILKNNNKCINVITSGNFVPLQSVKEDECLEIDVNNNEKYSKVNRFF